MRGPRGEGVLRPRGRDPGGAVNRRSSPGMSAAIPRDGSIPREILPSRGIGFASSPGFSSCRLVPQAAAHEADALLAATQEVEHLIDDVDAAELRLALGDGGR